MKSSESSPYRRRRAAASSQPGRHRRPFPKPRRVGANRLRENVPIFSVRFAPHRRYRRPYIALSEARLYIAARYTHIRRRTLGVAWVPVTRLDYGWGGRTKVGRAALAGRGTPVGAPPPQECYSHARAASTDPRRTAPLTGRVENEDGRRERAGA